MNYPNEQYPPPSQPPTQPAPPTGPPTLPTPKVKQSITKQWWFWVIVALAGVLFIYTLSSFSSRALDRNSAPEAVVNETAVVSEPEVEEKEPVVETTPEPEPSVPTEYKSALRKGQTYSDMMHMSYAGIYEQLVSEYGEGFSPEAAQYAVDNIDVDWNYNALQKAITYQDLMAMSPSAIYEQLISEYGEKFTPEQAQYAIDNLP